MLCVPKSPFPDEGSWRKYGWVNRWFPATYAGMGWIMEILDICRINVV